MFFICLISTLPRRRQGGLEFVGHLGWQGIAAAGDGAEGGHGLDQQADLLGFEFVAVGGFELFDGLVLVGKPVFDGQPVVGAEDVDIQVAAAAGEPEVLLGDALTEADLVVVAFV